MYVYCKINVNCKNHFLLLRIMTVFQITAFLKKFIYKWPDILLQCGRGTSFYISQNF